MRNSLQKNFKDVQVEIVGNNVKMDYIKNCLKTSAAIANLHFNEIKNSKITDYKYLHSLLYRKCREEFPNFPADSIQEIRDYVIELVINKPHILKNKSLRYCNFYISKASSLEKSTKSLYYDAFVRIQKNYFPLQSIKSIKQLDEYGLLKESDIYGLNEYITKELEIQKLSKDSKEEANGHKIIKPKKSQPRYVKTRTFIKYHEDLKKYILHVEVKDNEFVETGILESKKIIAKPIQSKELGNYIKTQIKEFYEGKSKKDVITSIPNEALAQLFTIKYKLIKESTEAADKFFENKRQEEIVKFLKTYKVNSIESFNNKIKTLSSKEDKEIKDKLFALYEDINHHVNNQSRNLRAELKRPLTVEEKNSIKTKLFDRYSEKIKKTFLQKFDKRKLTNEYTVKFNTYFNDSLKLKEKEINDILLKSVTPAKTIKQTSVRELTKEELGEIEKIKNEIEIETHNKVRTQEIEDFAKIKKEIKEFSNLLSLSPLTETIKNEVKSAITDNKNRYNVDLVLKFIDDVYPIDTKPNENTNEIINIQSSLRNDFNTIKNILQKKARIKIFNCPEFKPLKEKILSAPSVLELKSEEYENDELTNYRIKLQALQKNIDSLLDVTLQTKIKYDEAKKNWMHFYCTANESAEIEKGRQLCRQAQQYEYEPETESFIKNPEYEALKKKYGVSNSLGFVDRPQHEKDCIMKFRVYEELEAKAEYIEAELKEQNELLEIYKDNKNKLHDYILNCYLTKRTASKDYDSVLEQTKTLLEELASQYFHTVFTSLEKEKLSSLMWLYCQNSTKALADFKHKHTTTNYYEKIKPLVKAKYEPKIEEIHKRAVCIKEIVVEDLPEEELLQITNPDIEFAKKSVYKLLLNHLKTKYSNEQLYKEPECISKTTVIHKTSSLNNNVDRLNSSSYLPGKPPTGIAAVKGDANVLRLNTKTPVGREFSSVLSKKPEFLNLLLSHQVDFHEMLKLGEEYNKVLASVNLPPNKDPEFRLELRPFYRKYGKTVVLFSAFLAEMNAKWLNSIPQAVLNSWKRTRDLGAFLSNIVKIEKHIYLKPSNGLA